MFSQRNGRPKDILKQVWSGKSKVSYFSLALTVGAGRQPGLTLADIICLFWYQANHLLQGTFIRSVLARLCSSVEDTLKSCNNVLNR